MRLAFRRSESTHYKWRTSYVLLIGKYMIGWYWWDCECKLSLYLFRQIASFHIDNGWQEKTP